MLTAQPAASLNESLSGSTAARYEGPRLPPMPEIGLDEHVYAQQARLADELADRHAREAAKVGLYLTLALRPKMSWPDKLRHFKHAMSKHCHTNHAADHRVWSFYHDLCVLAKSYCGQEALRLACEEDDRYAARLRLGNSRETIEVDAERFFHDLIGHGKDCPDYLMPDDFKMLKMIRDQWI